MRQCSNMVYQWGLPADLENKNGLYLDFYHAETYGGEICVSKSIGLAL